MHIVISSHQPVQRCWQNLSVATRKQLLHGRYKINLSNLTNLVMLQSTPAPVLTLIWRLRVFLTSSKLDDGVLFYRKILANRFHSPLPSGRIQEGCRHQEAYHFRLSYSRWSSLYILRIYIVRKEERGYRGWFYRSRLAGDADAGWLVGACAHLEKVHRWLLLYLVWVRGGA